MRKLTMPAFLAVVGLVLLCSGSVLAFDFDFNFDDLFGDDLIVEEESPWFSHEDALLTSESVDIGGNYRFTVDSAWLWLDQGSMQTRLGTNLGGELFLDARPNADYRVFMKGKIDYDLAKSQARLRLTELFSDFNIDNRVFFRGGKSMVNWGVGYFFSPADVINIGRIDPHDPEANREGPVSLRVNLPQRTNNYALHFVFDGAEKLNQIALAPRVQFVLGGSEISLGGYYRSEKAPRAMATISSTVKGVSVFGEAMASMGSDKLFLQVDADSPLGLTVVERDELFLHGTVGARFSKSFVDGPFNIVGAAQYLFNGEGYIDQSVLDDPVAILTLVNQGAIPLHDLDQTGRHYMAISLGLTDLFGTDLSTNTLWLGNLSDSSGQWTTTLSLGSLGLLRPSVGVTKTYGDAASQMIFAQVSLGGGSF